MQRPTCITGNHREVTALPKKKKKPRAPRGSWQLSSELKPLGKLRPSHRLGNRGESEDLGAMTGPLVHSEVNDSKAVPDGSACGRAVCAGSQAAVGTPADAPAFGWVALPGSLGQ